MAGSRRTGTPVPKIRLGRVIALAGFVSVLAMIGGCGQDDDKAEHRATQAEHVVSIARTAAERYLQENGATPKTVLFRGVSAWTQAIPQRVAVCGQVSPYPGDPTLFVPFVSVVTVTLPADGTAPYFKFDAHVGSSTSEASRVYVATAGYCYEGGGPSPNPVQSGMPLPPLPEIIPDPATRPARLEATPLAVPAAPAPVAGQPPVSSAPSGAVPGVAVASGTVTMRQNGYLHADPRSPGLRVIPQGQTMRVFGQAPGGWYQVGADEPWGWVHESMLERR